MIAVVDYGAGNIKSVQNALEHLGAEYRVTQNPKAIRKASKIILPGVGNFGAAMKVLNSKGLSGELIRAIKGGKPYLGICLGLQLLFEESEETKGIKGLGIFKGKVIRFRGKMKIPHMGWNSIKKRKDSGLLEGIDNGSYFYFVHSFYPEPKDKKIILTTTNYGKEFVSGIEHKNISAFQFHPEKSGEIGIKILKRFCR
ncbi:MAG TPA: imidazole glycerol phosphate synthase subunit HisH [Candidatus Nanoarchaeia archaeon]|nr:imidazole glycerol phosphate synthase subunit HisH [Candidatus Nanoarchaeia archaeon]